MNLLHTGSNIDGFWIDLATIYALTHLGTILFVWTIRTLWKAISE